MTVETPQATASVPSLSIRPLAPEDADAYSALRLFALGSEPAAFMSSYEEEVRLTRAEFEKRAVPEPPGVTFGAFAGGALVGMAGYLPERRVKRRHKAVLIGVFLRPEWRGNGHGRQLVEAVIAHARAQGVIFQCTVRADSASARRLYDSLGFRSYGMEPAAVCVDGRLFDDELLMLDLRAG